MFADLFNHAEHYPNTPGYRRTDTSMQAAADVAPRAKVVREKVLACVRSHAAGLTTEEIAALLSIPYATIQPRTSELRTKSLIFDSGRRRMNQSSGKQAIVWVAPQAAAGGGNYAG